jgi:xanthine dehydrogenase YagS FAD-binding subunit
MEMFSYERVTTLDVAVRLMREAPASVLVAGGTELANWLKDGIVRPARLLDINVLPGLGAIEVAPDGLRIGALVRVADLAANLQVRRESAAIPEALSRSTSRQLRNMASMGGNLLQRTRCAYFRSPSEPPCNKRRPGLGCAALVGTDRGHAIFGWSDNCIATHPSDVAVALAALDAEITLQGPAGARTVPLTSFCLHPSDDPERDTAIGPAELITAITVPASPVARRSWYLKVRERTSYEFALVSVAAAVDLDDRSGTIREARLALGGVAPMPWRLPAAEDAPRGRAVADRSALLEALEDDFAKARPRRENGFKVELARRAVVRTIQLAAEIAQ